MTPDVVVDVGNTRMKWGHCPPGGGVDRLEALPLNLPSVWLHHFKQWDGTSLRWAVAGSNGERRDAFADWLRCYGGNVFPLTNWKWFGVPVKLPAPERIGHDRLLNARAARDAVSGSPVVVVSAGTAVTVDLVDADGTFRGGAIFPGVWTMAKSLYQFTAALPLVEVEMPHPPLPGTATEPAIAGGIWWAAVGGIRAVVAEYQKGAERPPRVLLTGGDGELLRPGLPDGTEFRPHLTLEGIRLAAEGCRE
jgi:type III pantothenate kinase